MYLDLGWKRLYSLVQRNLVLVDQRILFKHCSPTFIPGQATIFHENLPWLPLAPVVAAGLEMLWEHHGIILWKSITFKEKETYDCSIHICSFVSACTSYVMFLLNESKLKGVINTVPHYFRDQ